MTRIKPHTTRSKIWFTGLLLGTGTLAIAGYAWHRTHNETTTSPEKLSSVANKSQAPAVEPSMPSVITQSNWQASGIQLQPLQKSPFSETVRLTGRISLNEDQISHVYPMVEGSVDKVMVGLGQVVKADEVLVIVHSRVIGQAKLELYQARLAHEMAVVKDQLQREVAENARKLLVVLREQKPIIEIEAEFRNRSMGEYRERLLLAYSNYLKAEADVQRLESIASDGAISGKQLQAAVATRNADQATFQSRIEQVEYDLRTALVLSEQSVKEAATRVAVAETNLRILGCEEKDIESIDPKSQGQAISDYTIRAPIDGTVISKDATLREQIRPDAQIIRIADLSTVWITADIYQQHVPLLSSIAGKPIKVRNDAWPDRSFEAKIFYTGEIMDEATRTIALRAVAENPEHLLKPGMFVTIELTGQANSEPVLQIPSSAVLEHQSAQFVFVKVADDQFQR
ncbi:MAG: efflux RND transporter periplasmic adaptor subunit, partial [Pirellulales bacterium]